MYCTPTYTIRSGDEPSDLFAATLLRYESSSACVNSFLEPSRGKADGPSRGLPSADDEPAVASSAGLFGAGARPSVPESPPLPADQPRERPDGSCAAASTSTTFIDAAAGAAPSGGSASPRTRRRIFRTSRRNCLMKKGAAPQTTAMPANAAPVENSIGGWHGPEKKTMSEPVPTTRKDDTESSR